MTDINTSQGFDEFEGVILGEAVNAATLQLPDPDLLAYYKHLTGRRIWADYEVDDSFLTVASNILLWNIEDAGKPVEERIPIWLYMFNYGGSADIMWMIIDVIKRSETPVYTVNMGQCGSAAALIFMAGHVRYMFPMASVLIHEGAGKIDGDAIKVLDQAESYKAMIKRMRDYILANTDIPPAILTKKKNNDWELNSELCMKYRVCDKLVTKISEVF